MVTIEIYQYGLRSVKFPFREKCQILSVSFNIYTRWFGDVLSFLPVRTSFDGCIPYTLLNILLFQLTIKPFFWPPDMLRKSMSGSEQIRPCSSRPTHLCTIRLSALYREHTHFCVSIPFVIWTERIPIFLWLNSSSSHHIVGDYLSSPPTIGYTFRCDLSRNCHLFHAIGDR